MATSSNESLSELERRSEQTRAELAQTVDALHNRVSPSAIKADVKSYIRDNPLQAAAIAVGAAYPVWRMVGAIPAPVLLIGAGLAMARRGNGNGSVSSYGNGYSGARSTGEGMMAGLKDKASDLTSQITGKAQDTFDSLRDKVSDTTARTTDTLSSTYDSTKQAAADTLHQVSDRASETYARVSDRASETYARASESLAEIIERNPLLVGGVAFAVGSMIAAAVPVSRQENRLMGESAEELRRRSQEMAMQGFRQAKDVAQQVYETASEEVRNEGLTPEAARRTARTAVESARDAMERTTSGTNRS